MTDEQTRDLVETLWQLAASSDVEAERWRKSHPDLAAKYDVKRAAYRHVLDLIAAAQGEIPANPLHPPAPASSYVGRT